VERAVNALLRILPSLQRAQKECDDFHSAQQTLAEAELNEQKRVLERHIDYFGASAPIK
jgi:hypothetical protein